MKHFISGLITGICLGLSFFFVQNTKADYQRLEVISHQRLNEDKYRSDHIYVVWDDAEKTNCYIISSHDVRGGNSIDCVRSKN